MKRILPSILTLVLALSACSAPTTKGIEVHDARMRPAAQGENGAVYFVIRSSEADELVGVTSDVADAIEIHESRMNGDVMEMRQLASLPLDAGQEVALEPGGLHLMLVGLKHGLEAGDEIAITLHFKKYQDVQLAVPVQEMPGSEMDH